MEQVRAWIEAEYALRLDDLTPVVGGADPKARLWRGTCADGLALAVKTSDGGSDVGARLMTLLAAAGVPGIPAPVATRDGGPSSLRNGVRLTLLPWIEVSSEPELGSAEWAQVGRALSAVHAVPLTDDLTALVPSDDVYVTAVLEDAALAGQSLRHRLTGPGQRDAPVRALAELWRAAGPLYAHLLTEAGRLRETLPPDPYVLCHADPHKGNLLVDTSAAVWLVDWDDTLLAPRERDLAFPLGGVSFFGPEDAASRQAFLHAYGHVEVHAERLAHYLALRGLEDLGSWALGVCDVRADDTSRARALAIVEECLSSRGIVTVAVDALAQLP